MKSVIFAEHRGLSKIVLLERIQNGLGDFRFIVTTHKRFTTLERGKEAFLKEVPKASHENVLDQIRITMEEYNK